MEALSEQTDDSKTNTNSRSLQRAHAITHGLYFKDAATNATAVGLAISLWPGFQTVVIEEEKDAGGGAAALEAAQSHFTPFHTSSLIAFEKECMADTPPTHPTPISCSSGDRREMKEVF